MYRPMHENMQVCMYEHIPTYMHKYIYNTHACLATSIHIYIALVFMQFQTFQMYACIHTYNSYISAHIYTFFMDFLLPKLPEFHISRASVLLESLYFQTFHILYTYICAYINTCVHLHIYFQKYWNFHISRSMEILKICNSRNIGIHKYGIHRHS